MSKTSPAESQRASARLAGFKGSALQPASLLGHLHGFGICSHTGRRLLRGLLTEWIGWLSNWLPGCGSDMREEDLIVHELHIEAKMRLRIK